MCSALMVRCHARRFKGMANGRVAAVEQAEPIRSLAGPAGKASTARSAASAPRYGEGYSGKDAAPIAQAPDGHKGDSLASGVPAPEDGTASAPPGGLYRYHPPGFSP